MAGLSEIQTAIDVRQWDDAIRALASVLSSAWQGERVAAWEKYCQGADNLLWRYAKECASQMQCQATVELLRKPAVLAFVDNHAGQRAGHLLRGLIRSVQAAAERKQGAASNGKYVEESAESFRQVFSPLAKQDTTVGEAMALWVVDRIRSPDQGNSHRAWTWGLLDGPGGKAIEIGIELVPGETGRLVPDVLAIGPVDIDDDFVKTLIVARDRATIPAGHQLVWKLRRHEGLDRIGGGSVGAAMAAAVQGAVEGVTLDTSVAVSATLDADGNLGKVDDGAGRKLQYAANVGCDQVLFHPDTKVTAREEGANNAGPLSEIVRVETMDEVWEHLSFMHRVISAHQRHAKEEWDSQWSEVIGGEEEAPDTDTEKKNLPT